MTVPLGVPNLPVGALTLENLAAKLQDQTVGAVRNLANERVPSIFNGSTGGAILSNLSPFGIITHIWAAVMAGIANADPADIDGPEDLPGLLLDFIEGLPVIGQLIQLFEAIMGTYDGDDPVLLAVQQIFFPIRKLLALVSGQDVGIPTVEEITVGWVNLADALADAASDAAAALVKLVHVNVDGLYDAAAGFTNQAFSLLKNLDGGTGLYDASVGFVNQGASILRNLDGTGRFLAGQLYGDLTAAWAYTIDVAVLVDSGVHAFHDGLLDAERGFANFLNSPLKFLEQAGADIGKFDASALSNMTGIPAIAGSKVSGALTGATLTADKLLSGALATGVAITTAGGTIATDAVESIWGLSDLGADTQAVVNAVTQASQGISAAINQNVSAVLPAFQAVFQSVIPHFW